MGELRPTMMSRRRISVYHPLQISVPRILMLAIRVDGSRGEVRVGVLADPGN
jgi:hypothetical protein